MRSLAALLTLAVSFAPAGAGASVSPEVVLYTDPVADGVLLGPALPPQIDLVEGRISESTSHLIVTWELLNIPDGTQGLPLGQRLDFEFSLRPATLPMVEYGVRLETTRSGTTGYLEGNCMQGAIVTCTRITNAQVTTSVDAAANTFTAAVRRSDLKSAGVSVAVDGTVLEEAFLYRGIASYLGTAVVTHNLSDQADMLDGYVLGSAWG